MWLCRSPAKNTQTVSLFPPLHFSIKRGGGGEEVDRMRDSQPALCFCCITVSQHFVKCSAVADVFVYWPELGTMTQGSFLQVGSARFPCKRGFNGSTNRLFADLLWGAISKVERNQL